jgi:hypothetical protein
LIAAQRPFAYGLVALAARGTFSVWASLVAANASTPINAKNSVSLQRDVIFQLLPLGKTGANRVAGVQLDQPG